MLDLDPRISTATYFSLIASARVPGPCRYQGFTNAPKRQVIFGPADAWAGKFRSRGLFAQTPVSAPVRHTGSGELLVASAAYLLGACLRPFACLQTLRCPDGTRLPVDEWRR